MKNKKPLSKKEIIIKVPFEWIVKKPFIDDAIIRDDFPGFKEDYQAIHSIIRKYIPRKILEIGTSQGTGTNVICNAMGIKKGRIKKYAQLKKVISIDVPPGTDPKKIYPKAEDGHPQQAGANCTFPYKQIFGNSIKYDFSSLYPIDAWFIDGKHDYEYCSKDTRQALKSNPNLIIWHDMQIKGVHDAVVDVMYGKGYDLYWVDNTRVAFAIKN